MHLISIEKVDGNINMDTAWQDLSAGSWEDEDPLEEPVRLYNVTMVRQVLSEHTVQVKASSKAEACAVAGGLWGKNWPDDDEWMEFDEEIIDRIAEEAY